MFYLLYLSSTRWAMDASRSRAPLTMRHEYFATGTVQDVVSQQTWFFYME